MELSGSIAVVSPHLDDGVLSLGAAIAAWAERGMDVRVVTVVAGDPDSVAPASAWDRACGFTTAGAAARVRRNEDRVACEVVGAIPVWLPFGDLENERGGGDEEIWAAIAERVDGAKLMLVPGFPLIHPDHAWLARLLLEREPLAEQIGLYVEQPYAVWQVVGTGFSNHTLRRLGSFVLRTGGARRQQAPCLDADVACLLGSPPLWTRFSTGARARRAKRRALGAYRSQISRLGRWLPSRIALYEWSWGGEGIGWLDELGDRRRLYAVRGQVAGEKAPNGRAHRPAEGSSWG